MGSKGLLRGSLVKLSKPPLAIEFVFVFKSNPFCGFVNDSFHQLIFVRDDVSTFKKKKHFRTWCIRNLDKSDRVVWGRSENRKRKLRQLSGLCCCSPSSSGATITSHFSTLLFCSSMSKLWVFCLSNDPSSNK